MFATLANAYPWPPDVPRPAASRSDAEAVRTAEDAAVRRVLRVQEAAGLEPLTDGQLRWPDPIGAVAAALGAENGVAGTLPTWTTPIALDDWRFAAGATGRAVKQVLVGPYTLGRRVDPGAIGREKLTLAFAEALNAEVGALAEAGCPLAQIDEHDATLIGDDPAERRLFIDAQRRLTDGVTGTHLSLAVTGGSADGAGPDTIFDAPYQSYLFDLIDGPDNWRLIANAPGDRGIVCGAMTARTPTLEAKEILIWAANYAASTAGRGLDRVGLAPAGSLAALSWDDAAAKVQRLSEAVSVAALPDAEQLAAMDPRAVDSRSAAVGRYEPRPRRTR